MTSTTTKSGFKILDKLFLFIAVIFAVLAAIGTYQHYTPIPFGDMWGGYIGGVVASENLLDWAGQHNEHRILLSRILFFIDLNLFAGESKFLILMNYVLLAAAAAMFCYIWLKHSEGEDKFIGFFLVAWVFYWIQHENLVWAFQSQFILAQLFPLIAFYLLHKAQCEERAGTGLFLAATIVGFLSGWTMANGTVALPLMTVYLLVIGASYKRITLLAGLSALNLWLYYHDFFFPSHHGSFFAGIMNDPMVFLDGIAVYVGGPIYYMVRDGVDDYIYARIAGYSLMAFSAIFTLFELHKGRKSSLTLILLLYILYIGATAAGTSGGRLIFGTHHFISGRYQTPSIMAWAAFFIIVASKVDRRIMAAVFLVTIAMMWDEQRDARKPVPQKHYDQGVAMLAVELEIADEQQVPFIFYNPKLVLRVASVLNDLDISIFGMAPYQGLRESWNTPSKFEFGETNCATKVLGTNRFEGTKYSRVEGILDRISPSKAKDFMHLVDAQRNIVGFAILKGKDKKRDKKSSDNQVQYRGYVLSSSQYTSISAVGAGFHCSEVTQWPVFSASNQQVNSNNISITQDHVVGTNEWLGGSYTPLDVDGLVVKGSYINSDQDTGSIRIKMQRGDKLYYSSGPVSENQFINIIGTDFQQTALPPAREKWLTLDFNSDQLPDEFVVELTDNGTGWGQWSAVAIKE